jgi:tight adherence protein B
MVLIHGLIIILVFFAASVSFLALYTLVVGGRARAKEALLQRLCPAGGHGAGETGNLLERRVIYLERYMERFIDMSPVRSLIAQAGFALPAGAFLLICFLTGVAGCVTAALIFKSYSVTAAAFAGCGALPAVYLRIKSKKRDDALEAQLADAVTMVSRSLRAGRGLDAALQDASRHFDAPIGRELTRIYKEMDMGLSFESAVRNFSDRFKRVSAVKIFCSACLIQRETGGNLASMLENISHAIRARLQLYRKVRALSAEGRSSAVIIGSLPLVFFLITYFTNPDYLRVFFEDATGKMIFFVALMCEAIGFSAMLLIVRIRV